MTTTRTFLAIELDDPTRAFIQDHVRELTRELPHVRFVAAATWHITLAFLGDLDAAQLAAARLAAHDAAATAAPFTLQATGIGSFGADDAPQVIWVGVGGMTAALFALQQQVVVALRRHQVPFDDRPYAPHITLARLRDLLTPAEAAALRDAKARSSMGPALPVTAISVMKSELSPTGAHYTALDRVPLAASR